MAVIVKNLGGGKKTATYFNGAEQTFIELLPGRNRIEDEVWDKIKVTDFIQSKLGKDEITFSELVEKEEEVQTEKPDAKIAEGFIGMEDGKDLLYDYAKKFGIILKRNMNIDNMYKDFVTQVG